MAALKRAVAGVIVCAAVVLGGSVAAAAQGSTEGRMLRFPDVHGNQVVFSYGGDLWLTTTDGGVARRITTNPGLEMFPHFSPDGKWIAFTAQYDGNFNVYVIPAEGGQPRQLTFVPDIGPVPERMGPNNEVMAWTPDSQRIVFLSRRDTFNSWFGHLWTVSVDGGLPKRLDIDRGGLLAFNADGSEMVYNRIFRNFRTWKRYTGGMAQKLSLWNFKTHHYEQLTNDEWTDTFPMWRGDTVYFASDRGEEHRLNLYAMDMKSHAVRQLTHYKDFDVEWPSLNGDRIIFENGGWLYLYDTKTEKTQKLDVQVEGDFDQVRKHWDATDKLIDSADISPDGKRAAFTARGDVYTVPAEHGAVRNLTSTPGIREQNVAWSPDGKWVAYLTDRSGEQAIAIRAQDGKGEEQAITTGGPEFLMQPVWSPDSSKIAWADSSLHLYYTDIKEKKPVLVDTAKYGEITNYSWSPDSKWVAYDKTPENGNPVIEIYSLAGKRTTAVTTDFFGSLNPVFDPGRKYLYFVSFRTFNEVIGVYDNDFANPQAAKVYAVTLRADEASPFAPQSDEVTVKAPDTGADSGAQAGAKKDDAASKKDDSKDASKDEKKDDKAKEPFRIDVDGIQNRVVALPTPPGNLGNLGAADGRVFYASTPTYGYSGPLPGLNPEIHVFDLDKRKDHVLVAGATGYALSFDGKKLLYAGPGNRYGIVDAAAAGETHHLGEGALDLAGVRAEIDPRAEWKDMFNEAWRQERTFFYSKAMNGVNWAAERDKYAQLLPYVADRYDLDYLIGEMFGELSNSHMYVGGGDYPDLHPVNEGMLGVDFKLDEGSGRYQMARILPGQNWDGELRSPLTEPGAVVHAGDYLLAVNGHELKAPQNPYELFVNTANQNVTLTVNAKPTLEGAHDVTVQPAGTDFKLRELDWIETNREKVDKLSDGKIGYVYLPDMGAPGLNEFVKQYFPQIRKQAIIFDVRYNGGGNVDQIILERLRRILVGMSSARNWAPSTVPGNVFNGYMACLTNHYAASDGDIFTYYFKFYKLGPVIGTRTWGGVRGIRGEFPLMDGGYITRSEFSLYGLNSQWIVENHGVQPDIELENTPDQLAAGHDPQLEKAVDLLMQQIREHPKTLPPAPPEMPAYPDGPGF
ncbi:MAG TPA: PDZ domain-containing protein [Acidobacteriaceae bacterium]|jgi:tricorn protease|nr:PDZ domain-containing protein [Acidobacteriaceae bacterium]